MRILKGVIGFAGLTVATVLAVSAIAYAAVTWGPSRPTYTWATPANHITFNSITDSPVWGDERFLIKARDVNASSSANSTSVSVSDNQELLVTVHFHNNAASNLNLTAQNTKVKVALPSGSTSNQELKATISADNATPQSVFSTMDLTSGQPFTLQYISGSAKLKTNYVNGVSVSDSIVGAGALVGTSGTDGKVQGCAQFSGYVSFRVKVKVEQPQPESKFACKALDVTKVNRTRFDFTAHATVTNATVQSYVFTAKDSNGNVVDTQTVNTSALSAGYTFNQDKPGTYTISVVVKTDKGDAPVGNCVTQVTIEEEEKPVPPVVSGKVTELPDTGAGAVAGIFAGVSALAGAGHYVFRRYIS